MTKEEIYKLAADKLSISDPRDLEQNSKEIEDLGYYFWKEDRGGQQFIIGYDGGYLFGVSATGFDELVNAYKAGKRSE